MEKRKERSRPDTSWEILKVLGELLPMLEEGDKEYLLSFLKGLAAIRLSDFQKNI